MLRASSLGRLPHRRSDLHISESPPPRLRLWRESPPQAAFCPRKSRYVGLSGPDCAVSCCCPLAHVSEPLTPLPRDNPLQPGAEYLRGGGVHAGPIEALPSAAVADAVAVAAGVATPEVWYSGGLRGNGSTGDGRAGRAWRQRSRKCCPVGRKANSRTQLEHRRS